MAENGMDFGSMAALMDRDNGSMWNNPFVYLVWIWAFSAFGNGGFGGFGSNNGAAMGQVNNDFLYTNMRADNQANFSQLDNDIRSMQTGMFNGFSGVNSAISNGFAGVNATVNNGFANLHQDMCNTRSDFLLQLNQLGYQQQNCCCETNRNIDSLRFQNEKNTSDIINAMHNEASSIKEQMTQNTIQELRDRLQDAHTQLQGANLALNNEAQTRTIVDQIRPVSKPAYITCSPYQTVDPIFYSPFCGNVGKGCASSDC